MLIAWFIIDINISLSMYININDIFIDISILNFLLVNSIVTSNSKLRAH